MTLCSNWISAADLDTGTDEVKAEAAAVASEILYRRAGHRWPGECEATFRPTHRCPGECPGHTIDLALPLIEVVQILVDGEALDSGQYEIREGRYLVRMPDADTPDVPRYWPCRQIENLPDTAEGTWSITVRYGGTPPASGIRAARSLAEELAKARSGDECRLPESVTNVVREGLTFSIEDLDAVFEDGRIGIYDVDLFLSTVNPDRLRSRSRTINPDRIRERIRTSGVGS